METTGRYAVRRTNGVRPHDYGSLRGTDYGTFREPEEAIHAAQVMTRLGYPSRVVNIPEAVVVWARPWMGTPSS